LDFAINRKVPGGISWSMGQKRKEKDNGKSKKAKAKELIKPATQIRGHDIFRTRENHKKEVHEFFSTVKKKGNA
jgi:hypothetical protein